MIRPKSVTRWVILSLTGLILAFGYAYAQQAPQTPPAQNPYSMGTAGPGQGPRGLTSYMPVAIDQPFAARMAHDVEAKPGIDRAHQAVLRRSAGQVRAQSAGPRSRTRQSSPRIKLIEELHVHASIQT